MDPDRLPLRTRTSRAWAETALRDPDALLEDHAHLEKKAAQNALALLGRWPSPSEDLLDVQAWTQQLTRIARDEIEHLGLVLGLLRRRGRALGRVHKNPYAAALRRLVREGEAPGELVDRLLVSALIEARSCERFGALADVAEDDALRRLYRGLLASERGHYRVFLGLAARVPGVLDLEDRWQALLDREAEILAAQPPGPRMHSGPAPGGSDAWGDTADARV
jgi:tRNA-(ms[2]io[6]A)-hydroxylase